MIAITYNSQSDLLNRFAFFFLITSVCVTVEAATLLITDDFVSRISIALLLSAVMYFSYKVSIFSRVSDNRIRLTAITLTSSVCISIVLSNAKFGFPADILQYAINLINQNYGIKIPDFVSGNEQSYISLLALIVMAVVAVFVTRGVQPATGKPARRLEHIIPEVNDQHRLILIREALINDISNIDRNTRWSDTRFVSLQAQVQVLSSGRMRSRIVDLIQALRNDQTSRIFLVLGDPGSGKSVAMRKLARDLLSENASGRIPIYINLKEWKINRDLSEIAPVTTQEFSNFVYENIKSRLLDFALQSFLFDSNEAKPLFEELREAGYLFFIFDSFDEIPAVLDHDENSWVIDQLSNCIASYAVAGLEARGVIASRLFRKPRLDQTKQSVLEIRPFSEEKILQAIDRAKPRNSQVLIEGILSKRPDLGHLAKNPFLLNLIIMHYSHSGHLPSSQKEIFQTYFDRNVNYAREMIQYRDISIESLYIACEKISLAMLGGKLSSLEITKLELEDQIAKPVLERTLEFLVRSKIGRISNENEMFSFSHRRFNEFFLVRALENGSVDIPYHSIQSDTKWRDALVLYAEISAEQEALKLADHAWTYARRLKSIEISTNWSEFIEARHALRFLVDGFRNRPWILPMRSEIAALVRKKVRDEGDLIEKRTVLEAITLIEPQAALPIIERVFRKHQGWLSEGAATATRYLPSIAPSLALAFYYHVTARPGIASLNEAKVYSRTLSISDASRDISKWLKLYRMDFYKSILIAVIVQAAALAFYGSEALLLSFVAIVTYMFFIYFLRFTERLEVVARPEHIFKKQSRRSNPSKFRFGPALIKNGPVLFKIVMLVSLSLPITVLIMAHFFHDESLSGTNVNPFSYQGNRPLAFLRDLSANTIAFIIVSMTIMAVPMQPPPYIVISKIKFNVLLKSIVFVIPLLAIISAFMWVVYAFVPPYIVRAFLIGFAICSLIPASISIYYWVADSLRLRRARLEFDGSKASIAENFLEFNLPEFRLRYVSSLESLAIDRKDEMGKLNNAWPNDKRPQIKGDPASSELARLDARWLGLD